jgi:hypothetical protein
MGYGKHLLGLLLPLAVIAAAAAAEQREVLAQVAADLNSDGIPDRAALLADRDEVEVDLAVTLSANGALPAQPVVVRGFGWRGAMAGTEPQLSVNARGSLVAVFQNDGVGRNHWRQQFTLAVRDGRLVVAGYTYAARDTLDPAGGGNCDVNFLTGKALRNGKPAAGGLKPVPVTEWSADKVPAVCSF